MAQRDGERDATARPTAAAARDIARSSPNAHRLRQSHTYREQVRRLHQLGPCPVGELLGEIVAIPDAAPVLTARLEVYASLDPRLVDRFGTDDWLESRALVRGVAEGSA